jgi:hypothetical protein
MVGRKRPSYDMISADRAQQACAPTFGCDVSHGGARAVLLLAVPVIRLGHAEDFPRTPQAPLVRVGVTPHVRRRVVGDEVVEQVGVAGVGELMGLARRVKERIARDGGRGAGGGAHGAGAAQEDEQLPLCGMRVERPRGLAGGNLGEFEVEGMAFARPAVEHVADGAGQVLVALMVFALG